MPVVLIAAGAAIVVAALLFVGVALPVVFAALFFGSAWLPSAIMTIAS